jgi:hypothetical protein
VFRRCAGDAEDPGPWDCPSRRRDRRSFIDTPCERPSEPEKQNDREWAKPDYLQWMQREDFYDDTKAIAAEALGRSVAGAP